MSTNGREKLPLQSKKFIAYLVSDLSLKAILVLLIILHHEKLDAFLFGSLLTIVFVSGFVTVGYVLGQASLDKFVRLAEITGRVVSKRLTAGHPPENGGKPPVTPPEEPTVEEVEEP